MEKDEEKEREREYTFNPLIEPLSLSPSECAERWR